MSVKITALLKGKPNTVPLFNLRSTFQQILVSVWSFAFLILFSLFSRFLICSVYCKPFFSTVLYNALSFLWDVELSYSVIWIHFHWHYLNKSQYCVPVSDIIVMIMRPANNQASDISLMLWRASSCGYFVLKAALNGICRRILVDFCLI